MIVPLEPFDQLRPVVFKASRDPLFDPLRLPAEKRLVHTEHLARIGEDASINGQICNTLHGRHGITSLKRPDIWLVALGEAGERLK